MSYYYGSGPRPNYASDSQKGEAAELRYGVPHPLRTDLSQIIHSGDRFGPWADTPNPYRDLSNSYDPKAEAVLVKAREIARK